jgi:hypothetical protein
MKRKKIFLAIAFGTSVRDVLRTDTFVVLKNQKDLDIVIFAQDIESKVMREFDGENVFFEKLENYKPSFAERILLHFHKAVLRDKCRSIDLGNTAGDTKVLDRFTPLAKSLKWIFGYRKVTRMVFWLYKIFTRPTLYKAVFDKHKPDCVIVTRVLNYSMDYPLMRRAVKEKVPVISLVSSWDNLTSKAFFPFSLHALVVWNHVMKQEAIDLFDFPEDKIFVSGIPRYDLLFKEKNIASREDFFKRFGLDSSKKLVLYCTGSSKTGPTIVDPVSPQPKIAKYIAEEIQSGRFSVPAQLMIRLHPQANADEYSELMNRKDVVVHIPGRRAEFHDRLFSKNDDIELAESMIYSDVVINLGSTVTLDAAVFDTPIICENIDINGPRPLKLSVAKFYEFDHFAKLKTTGGFALANSLPELTQQIDHALKHPEHLRENRKKIVEQQCVYTDGMAGKRTADFILDILDTLN